MNREIEFRAWLKDEKKMIKVSELRDIDTDIRSDQNVIYFDFEKQEYCNKGFDEVELMQYTGLKDKNGVKIFEGDIVEFDGDEIGVIKYTDGCFEIEADGFTETFYYNRYSYEVEVIGNVWENKELLENE